MNEEQYNLLLQRIQSEPDPLERTRLMGDLQFAMTMGVSPDRMADSVIRNNKLTPSDLGGLDSNRATVPADTYSGVVPPTIPSVATGQNIPVASLQPSFPAGTPERTLADLNGGNQTMTAADFMAAYGMGQQGSVSTSATGDGLFHRRPVIDLPQQMYGKSAREIIADSVLQRNEILDQLRQEEQDYLAQAQGYRTGELQVQRSGLTDMIEIAHTPEDFRRIKASGKIPVAARDANLILENARREANALLRAGEEAVDTAAINRRQILGEQAATALGSGVAAALTGVNVGASRLSELRQQAQQARQELMRGIETRRNSQLGAESLNSRAQIDAMIARLEPMQAISQLMQTDEMDRIQRQFQAEREAIQKAEASRVRRQAILENDLAFKTNAAQLAATAYTPVPGEFIQPRASSSANLRDVNAAVYARVRNAATQFETTLDTLKERANIFVDNDAVMQDVSLLAMEVDGIIQEAMTLSRSGQLLPEIARSVQSLIDLKNSALRGMKVGESSFGPRSAEDEIEDMADDPNSTMNISLRDIKNVSIFGNAPAQSATGGGTLDFSSYR